MAAVALSRGERLTVAWPTLREVEALSDCRDELEPDEAGICAAHLARAVADEVLDEARDTWRDAADRRTSKGTTVSEHALQVLAEKSGIEPIVRTLEQPALKLREARYQADLAAYKRWNELGLPVHPDAGIDAKNRRELAERVLQVTHEPAQELLSRLPLEQNDLGGLLRALRWRKGDGMTRPKERWRRLGAVMPFFEAVLSKRVRVEPRDGHLMARPRVLQLAPDDVRIVPGPNAGVLGELSGARLVGRALGLSLASPALPRAVQRAPVASVARCIGELLVQRSVAGFGWSALTRSERTRLLLQFRAGFVLHLRICAASTLIRGRAPRPTPNWVGVDTNLGEVDVDGELEALAEQALFVHVPSTLAGPLLHTPSGGGARLRASLGALTATVALRDRYDEDWHHNPRAEECLRNAATPAGRTSVEAWTAHLGVTPDHGLDYLTELLND